VAVNQGDALRELQAANRKIEATYELPFQAHATMEPMNTTIHVRENYIEVWSPTQIGEILQEEIAALSGLPANRVGSTCCFAAAHSAAAISGITPRRPGWLRKK
jgi:isoquinoline 1-oxidoreductase subunit beta